jgi:hypothetical protein
VLAGPAVPVFERKFGAIDILPSSLLETSIKSADFVLTGTGYGSSLEITAIVLARRQKVRVASYLDHWTNYGRRFDWEGHMVLPDEIWAGDSHALGLAIKTFPGACVTFVPNQYFEEMKRQIEAFARPLDDGGVHVLFVAEPISVAAEKSFGNARHWGYTEFDALDGYLTYLRSTGDKIVVMVRPHPAELPGKYRVVIEKHRNALSITESEGRMLAEDCAWADWVVGCDSMAMAIAVHAGKKVFSCIPRGGPPLSLPYSEITQLFS